MLAGDPFFSAALAQSGFDLSLRVDTSGEHVLRLVDTNSGDVVAQTPIDAITGPVLIVGSDHGDVLRIDVAPSYLRERVPGGVAFEGRAGSDRLRGPSADVSWYVTATNRGSIDGDDDVATAEILFNGVENLSGAALNEDTFVVLGSAGIDGEIDGGFGGFDSLAFQGGSFQSVAYSATGPDSGTIDRDAVRITYAGLEPILDLADIADLVIDTGDRDDRARLTDNGKTLTLAPSGFKSFETVVFKKPTNSLTITLGDDIGIPLFSRDVLTIDAVDLSGVAVTVNGQKGVDEVAFAGNLTCGNLTVNAETIAVNKGVVVSAADITLHAADTRGRSADPDTFPLADVDAAVRIDGGTLLGNDITLRADASLVSDVSNVPGVPAASLVACVSAEVAVTGNATITAAGLFTAKATSSVNATVNATPAATANAEIAVAAPVINNTAVSRLSGASKVTAGGAVTVAATTTTTVDALADGIEAFRAVGTTTAAPVVTAVTRAAIEDAAEVTRSAAIDVVADSATTITARASSTPDGALLNPATLEALGAATAAGRLTDAAAIAAATLSAFTRAELSTTGTVASDGAVSLLASSHHDVTSTADATPTVHATNNGFAVAVNNTTVEDSASIGGSPTIHATAVNVDTKGENRFAAVARSGAAGIGTANTGTLAGGFAFVLGKTVSRAFVAGGTALTLDPTTDLRIAADNSTFVDLSAEPQGAATIATGLGVGRSVAVNVLAGETRAEIAPDAEITGGRDLSIVATGSQESRVTAYAGTLAGEFGAIEDMNQVTVAASAARHATSATVGVGASSSVAGAVLVQATHQATNILRARGDAAGLVGSGPNEAFATPIALNLASDEAHATVAGSVSSAGGVTILSNARAHNEVESIAGVQGADPAATAADALVEAEIAFLADRANLAFGGSATPPATDPADLDTLLGNETAGMAAAIAVNLGRTATAADIAGGADVTAADGYVVVMATSDVDSTSLATATAVNTASGVAAAISLNTQFSETLAAISGAATADGIVVQAGVPREFVSTVRAEAASGVGRQVAGMSGAAAATQAQGSTAAVVGEGASLELTDGGSLLVIAATTLDNSTIATPHVVDGSTVGIGGSFELNSGAFQTSATIRGASVVGADDVTVTATGIHANTAAARAGGSGGAAAGGAVAVIMTANETFASFIGGGSPTSIAGNLLVLAVHEGVSTHSADAGSNAEDVGAGAAMALGVAQGGGRASLGGTLDVTGSTTVSAKTISSMDADAAASSAGVASGEPAAEAAIDEQLQRAFQAIVPAIQLDPVGGVDGAADALVVTNHGLATGDTILYAVGDGGPIGGLRDGATYFVGRVNANRIRLHATLDDAKSGRNPIDLVPVSGPATPHALQPGLPGAVRDLFTQGRLGTGDGAVGAAAAIALNVDLHATLAAIEPGAVITSGGPVQVLAVGSRGGAARNLDAFATAAAVDSTISLGTAAAVNISLQSNQASVAGSVSATEIRVESLLEEGNLEGDRSVRITADAVSGSGAGAETGVAAALAVNLLGLELPLDPIVIDIPPVELPPLEISLGGTISLPNIGCGETPLASLPLPTIPPLPDLPTFSLPDVAFSKGGKHAAVIRDGAVLALRDGGDLVVRSIYEGIATATASSSLQTTGTGSPTAIGVGPSVAANAVGQQTLAEIRDAVVTGVSGHDGRSDIRVIAEGTHALTADADAGAMAAIGLPAAVALNYSAATTTARLANTTGTSRIDGDLVVRATHASTNRHVAEIGAAGVGGAVALGYVAGGAAASSGMRIDVETGTVTVRAEHAGSLDAVTLAGQDGAATDPFGAVSSEAVESQLEGLLALAGLPEIPEEVIRVLQRASLATADGSVGAAAALSANLDYGFSEAVLADGGTISTNTAPVVLATGDMDVDALADASSVGGTSGLGVAVAMNVDGQRIETRVGGALTAPSLRVETLTSGDGVNTFRARAFSGAGADDVGVAGAFAINVSGDPAEFDDLTGDPGDLLELTGGGRHAARIADGATVTLTTASDLVVTTTYVGDYRAIATATPDGVDSVGVGPSVAVNAIKHTALAEIGAAVVVGARDILVTANGTSTTTTDAEAGVNNDGSLPAAIALTAAMNDTIARLTPAAMQTTISGDLRVTANHTAIATTNADADSSGAEVGFGAAIAAGGPVGGGRAIGGPNLRLDGDVVVRANTVAKANTVANASRMGAFARNPFSVDAETQRQLATLADFAGIAPIPFPAFDANPALEEPIDEFGAAAAISIAAGLPVSEAAIGAGATIVARGDVTVVAQMDFDTDADASALTMESASGVGVAAAGTYSQGLHVAEIAAAAAVEARSVALRTVADDDVAYDFSATAASAAAALGGAIAGSLAANAMKNHSAARIAADATVVSDTTVDVLANLRRGPGGSFENVARVESTAHAGEAAFGTAAAAGAAAAGSLALSGDTIEATIGNGASVTAGTGVTLRADREAKFDSEAVGGSLGLAAAASVGAAFGIADGTTRAVVRGATVGTTAGAIDVVAENDTEINSLSAGLAAAGIAAVGGAAAANSSGSVTEAAIDGAGSISSPDGVTVRAKDDSSFMAGAGSLAASFVAAAGAAVAVNATTSRVDAHISGARVTTGTGDVIVSAVSSTKADAVTLGFALAGVVAAQASAAMNDAGNSTHAGIDSDATIDSGGGVTLSAADDSTFTATSGGTAGATLASVGLAAAVNTTANEVHAIVDGKNTRITAADTLDIDATSTPALTATALGAGLGNVAAVGGAIVVNESKNSVRAEIRELAASLELARGPAFGPVPIGPRQTADRVELRSFSDTRSSAVAGSVAGAKFLAGSVIVAESAIGDSAVSAADGFIRTDHLDVLADAVRSPDASVNCGNFGPITVDAVVVAGRTSGTTEARIGSKADIIVTGGAVVVRATSTDTAAMKVVDPELVARVEISYLTSSAAAESDTRAHVDGRVSGPAITVAANAVKTATAETKVKKFSLARLSGLADQYLDFSEKLPDELPIRLPLTFDTSAVAEIKGDQSAYLAAGAVVTTDRRLTVKATSENTATANADLGGATLLDIVDLAGNAAIAGSTRMRIDSAATVAAGELVSKASATNRANAGGGSSAVSGIAVALAKLDASTDHAVVAQLGPADEQPADKQGSITVAAGGITIDASSVNRATVDPPVFEVSGVRVEKVLPRATAGGTTKARLGGRVTADAGPLGLTAKAVSNNVATTHAVAAEIGGFDLDLSKRAATTTHVTEAFVGAGARLTVTDGPLALSADSTSQAALDQTGVFDLTGLGITRVESEVDAGGVTSAFVAEACVITASKLAATATSDNDATIERLQLEVSGIDIDLARPRAATSHTTSAFIGPRDEPQSADTGAITVAAPITLTASSTNDATIKVVSLDAAGVAVEVTKPEISVGGSTQVRLGGRYLLNADVEGKAESISEPSWNALELGLTAARFAIVSPTVATRHDTEAFVDAGAELTALGRRIDLTATSRQAPTLERMNVGLSSVAFDLFGPTAGSYGATRAFVGESATVNAADLVLEAGATHSPTIDAASFVLGTATAASVSARTEAAASAVESFVGTNAQVTVTNDLVLHAAAKSTATTHAKGAAVAAFLSAAFSETSAVADPTVQAHLGRNSVVSAGRDVTLLAESDVVSDAIADAVAGAFASLGGSTASSKAAGSTRAFADDVARVSAGRDLTVRADAARTKADASADAYSFGLAGTVARPRSVAESRPFVQAFVDGPSITAGNMADIAGIALGNATATARGVSGALGLNVGTSKANATWRPTVDVHVAEDTTLEAQGGIVVRALNNHDASGSVDTTRRAWAEATASGGGGIDVRGATADADVRAAVTAEIRDHARLSAKTGGIRLESKSRNETRAIADQFGGGVVSLGSTEATGDMENESRALTGEGVVLEAGGDVTILGVSDNQADIDTEGGQGGPLARGGAKAEATLSGIGGGHRTQARIGDGSTIASGGRFELRAENRADIRAGAEQVISAALDANNETDATATIRDSLAVAELGSDVSVDAGSVAIVANDADVHAVAVSTATSNAAISFNVDADATVDATVGSRAAIGEGTSVVSNGPVTLWALQGPNPAEAATDPAGGPPGFRTRTAALAAVTGGAGITKATSTNLKTGTADVVAAAGSSITAGSLDVAAFPDRDRQSEKYVESAVTEDHTLVGTFVAAGAEVVTSVVDAFAGLFGGGRQDEREPTPGVESSGVLDRAVNTAMQNLPAPVVRGSIDFNADVTITTTKAELEIDADGKVTRLKNAVVRDALGNAVPLGGTIPTRAAFVDDIVIPAGGISLLSQGAASGLAAFAFEPASDVVTLTNRAAKNLFVNDIHVFATGAPSVSIVADKAKAPGPSPLAPGPSPFKGGFLYELSSTAADMEVRVVNLDAADRDVTLVGSIDIQVGSVTIRNEGGSILAADQLDGVRPETAVTTESFIRARHLTLDAHARVGRTVGGRAEPVFARMVLIRDEPAPAIEAVGRGGVWLDTTVATGDATVPLTLGFGLPGSGGGRIDRIESPEGDVEILFRGAERVRPDAVNGGHVTTAADATLLLGEILAAGDVRIVGGRSGVATDIMGGFDGQIVRGRGVLVAADAAVVAGRVVPRGQGGRIGAPGSPLKADTTGGRLDASASGDVFLRESAGTMDIGSITSADGTATLFAAAGFTDIDADPEADVTAREIAFSTSLGAVGTAVNDVEIDGRSPLSAIAHLGIFVEETAGSLAVDRVITDRGDIRLTARDSAAAGEDLLVEPGGRVETGDGSVTLRGGDDVTLTGTVTATASLTVNGDFGNADPGVGTRVEVTGAISAAEAFITGDVDDDTINNQTDIATTIDSLAGNDLIDSGGGGDTIDGGPGNDRIWAGGGADTVGGGTGEDEIFGEDGADTIDGGDGNDTIRGGAGHDTARGGPGDDLILGNAGDDSLSGDDGNDVLYGGLGKDTLHGGLGNDRAYGEQDDDALNGGDGDDVLDGGAGDDAIAGDAGRDSLHGGAGVDTLFGGDNDDFLHAGDGVGDMLFGGPGNDYIVGSDDGGEDPDFNDTIRFGDVISGGDGDDFLVGLGGADDIQGNAGSDTIHGGTHADRITDAPGGGNVIDQAAPSPAFAVSDGPYLPGDWAEVSGSATDGGLTQAGGLEQASFTTSQGVYVAWVDWRNGNTEIYLAFHRHGDGAWTAINGSASAGGVSNDADQSRRPSVVELSNVNPATGRTETELLVAWTRIQPNGTRTIEVARRDGNGWTRLANPGQSGKPDHARLVPFSDESGLLAWTDQASGTAQVEVAQYVFEPGFYRDFLREPTGGYAVTSASRPASSVAAFDIATVESVAAVVSSHGVPGDHDIEVTQSGAGALLQGDYFLPGSNATLDVETLGSFTLLGEFTVGDAVEPTIAMQLSEMQRQGQNETRFSTDTFVAWHEITEQSDAIIAKVRHRASDGRLLAWEDMAPQFKIDAAPRSNAGSISDSPGYSAIPDLAASSIRQGQGAKHVFLAWKDDGVHGGPRGDSTGRSSLFVMSAEGGSRTLREQRLGDASGIGISPSGGAPESITITTERAGPESDGPYVVWTDSLSAKSGTTPSRQVLVRRDAGGDVNETPTAIAVVPSPAAVSEGQPAGTSVGTLVTTDPDAGDSFGYVLVPGAADNALFRIEGDRLLTNAVFNFEDRSSYTVLVRSTDQGGLSVEQSLPVAITNVEEPLRAELVRMPAGRVYRAGESLDFTVVTSRPVTVVGRPQIAVVVGRGVKSATYVSGSGTNTLLFRYVVARGDNAANVSLGDLILLPARATIRDGAGANMPLAIPGGVAPGVALDTLAPARPTITLGSGVAGGATEAEATQGGGVVTVGGEAGATIVAVFRGPAGQIERTVTGAGPGVRVPVALAMADVAALGNGIVTVTATVTDAAGNRSAAARAIFPLDTAGPTVQSVSIPAARIYRAGDVLRFVVTFSEKVTVRARPSIPLALDGEIVRQAGYVSGSGTRKLVFQYRVQADDRALRGPAMASAIALNAGAITDAAGNGANLALSPPSLAGVLIAAPTTRGRA